MPTLASALKIDDMTENCLAKEPDSFLPITLFIGSWQAPKMQKLYERQKAADAMRIAGGPWAAFAKDASPGPWNSKFNARADGLNWGRMKSRDKALVPKVDKICLLPMPEANAPLLRCCPASPTGSRRRLG